MPPAFKSSLSLIGGSRDWRHSNSGEGSKPKAEPGVLRGCNGDVGE